MSATLPDRARIVVIGGGVIGTSVAYHLTKLGETDVVLVEQGQLSSGTTWHAAGLVGQLRASESGTRLVQYSTRLYAELEAETGLTAGYKQCGGVTVARSEDRMVQLRRTAANAAAYDLDCELLTPEQALERWPVMRVDDLVGAIWLPADGKANPADLTQALAKGARLRGARVVEHTRVTGVTTQDGRVTGVRTDAGDVEAEIVVNCAGQWALHVGRMAGDVNVPLHSAEHFYVVTEAIDGVHPDLPILRDPDGYTYFKEEVGGLVIGGFEPEAKPWVVTGRHPVPVRVPAARRGLGSLPDPDGQRAAADPGAGAHRYQEVLQRPGELHAGQPVHPGRGARVARISLSPPASTRWASPRPAAPDVRWPSGSSTGAPTSDLTGVDIRRFAPFNGNVTWLHDRVGRGPRPALRNPLAQPGNDDRPAVPALTRAPPAGRRQRELRQPDGLGARQLLRPGRALTRPSSTPGASRTGCRGRRPNRSAPAPAVTVFDQTSFSKYLLVGPRRRGRPAVAVHRRRRRRRRAARCTPGCSTRAAPTSPTSR